MTLKSKLIKWMAAHTADCRSLLPLFSAAIDRRLSLAERIRVRFHLLSCAGCANYAANLRYLREVFRALERRPESPAASAVLSPESKDRIKQALKSAE